MGKCEDRKEIVADRSEKGKAVFQANSSKPSDSFQCHESILYQLQGMVFKFPRTEYDN